MENKLTALAAKTKKPGQYSDGSGLYLIVNELGNRKWIFRFTFAGKVRNMGLGSAEIVSLSDAREARNEARRLVAAGVNPIEARRQEKSTKPTFGEMADRIVAERQKEWKNDKHAAQWCMTLKEYCAEIRPILIDQLTTTDILNVLKPVWERTPETGSRLRGRIETIINSAAALGFVSEDKANPARWKGHLEHLLSKRKKSDGKHHPALPYEEVSSFIVNLRLQQSMAAKALEFKIYTAARTGEVIGATWSEFDLENKLWVVPGLRMKSGREHRVPLTKPAMKILAYLDNNRTGNFVFYGKSLAKPLSDMALEMLMRRMNCGNRKWVDPSQNKLAVPHGFRSSFSDWANEETSFAVDVIEKALAHVEKDKVRGAYRRKDAFEKRRQLLEAWADYIEPK